MIAASAFLLVHFVDSGSATGPPYYGPAVLATTDLVGYWPLDETSGTTASDQTTSPANGTYHSGVTLGGAGAIQTSTDYAPTFNGSTGYVSVAAASKLKPTKSLSLEAWFKTTANTTQYIVVSGGGSGYSLYMSSGHLFGTVSNSGVESSATYKDGAWHYAVVTWNGSQIALYVDGSLVAPAGGYANPQPFSGTPSYSTYGLNMGERWDGIDFFNGSIDEPAVYGSSTDASAALGAGVIANHYTAAETGSVATPINKTPPTVSGKPLVGTAYTVTDNGSWDASTEIYGSLSFTYQWLRCGYDGTGCTAISGATSSSYTVASADNYHALAVKVTATNTGGNASATVALPAIGGYRTAVLTDGGSNLEGYWPLDETSSYPYLQTASDISTSPDNGSYDVGETLGQAGSIADGADLSATFSGTSSDVTAPSASKLKPTKSFTLEAWFKTTSSTGDHMILVDGGGGGLELYVESGHVIAWIDNTVIESAGTYKDGAWHYAVVTWDGTKITLYIDGVVVGPASTYSNPQSFTGTPSYSTYGVYIGERFDGIDQFNGSIDEAAIYGSTVDSSAALTAGEIKNHYILRSYQWLLASQTTGGTNDGEPGTSCGCDGSAADPVNMATGDFFESATDASVKSYGPAVSFTRTYDAALAQQQAQTSTPGPLGYGWTDNWNASLTANTTGTVIVTQNDGAQVTFYPPVSGSCPRPYVGPGTTGTYCALAAVTASLTYSASTSKYTFITHPYEKYTFNSSGQLTAEASLGGAAIAVTYNSPSPGSGSCPSTAASCETITSASGRALVIASNSSGEVTKVVDPLSRTWTYTYCSPPSTTCSTGDLVSVTDPMSRVTSYTYDEPNSTATLKHDLLTLTKPNGQTGGPDAGDKTVNVYDSSGRVTSQTDPSGYQTTLNYSNLDSGSGSGYVIATDPDGNETKTSYQNGVITGSVQGYGLSSPSTTTFEPDASTLLDTTIIDPNGNPIEYSYSGAGDVTSSTDQLSRTTTHSYNSFDEATCTAAPMAASACSSLSPPAAVTPGGTIAPPSSAPPAYVTYSEYDTSGNLVWTTQGDYAPGSSSASQERTTYSLYNGESVTISGNTDSCSTSAPSTALPCATIDPNGVVTQLGYNSSGDLTSTSTPDGNSGGEVAETTYGYDGDGEQTSSTAPDGNVSGGNAANYTTTTVYDNDGEVTSVTVGHTGGSYTARVTSYGYDGDGNKTSVTNPRGKVTTYGFNADDQQTLVTDPDSQATLMCYDGDGNLAETVPPVGVAASSLTPSSCPTSYPADYGDRLAADATTYAYDFLGNQTTVKTPAPAGQSGSETTTYTYFTNGQLATVTAPPTSNTVGASNQVTAYTYDDADQTLTITIGSGTTAASTTSYCYDPDGDKTAVVTPDGNTSGVVGCSTSSPFQTSSSYQTGYSYDSLGELVSETRPASTWASSGQTTSYSYDPAGNRLTTTDPNGITTTSTYSPLNQTASISYSGSSAHSVTETYDANGNRVSMVDGTGTSSYGYDPWNELTSYENGAGNTVSYSYNADGKTTGITYPLGSGASWATTDTAGYSYDNADELSSVTDFNNTITIGSTADGLPNSEALGSTGDTVTTTYDATGQASQITLANGSSTLLQQTYADVPSAAVVTETDSPAWSGSPGDFTYDPQSRVTQMTPGSNGALDYAFDASGNLTTLPTGASGVYDDSSELTSATLSGVTTSYAYDADGERVQATQGGSTIVAAGYNGARRLTGYSNSIADMTAATYDGDGLRQSATVTPSGGSATTEDFTWSTNDSLSQLILDSDNAYIYGVGATPIEQVSLSSGHADYLISDSVGSVRGIVDQTGAVVATESYDAWGNRTSVSGSASSPFGFAGGYTDPTGLIYLIARYFDSQTGQFITIDPLVDQTGAAYLYAGDNPINKTDPSGECSETSTGGQGGTSTGGVIDKIEATIGLPHFSKTAWRLFHEREFLVDARWNLIEGSVKYVTITIQLQWETVTGGWLNMGSPTTETVPREQPVRAAAKCKSGTVRIMRGSGFYLADDGSSAYAIGPEGIDVCDPS